MQTSDNLQGYICKFPTKGNLYRVLRIFTDFYGFLQIFKWILSV